MPPARRRHLHLVNWLIEPLATGITSGPRIPRIGSNWCQRPTSAPTGGLVVWGEQITGDPKSDPKLVGRWLAGRLRVCHAEELWTAIKTLWLGGRSSACFCWLS